MIRVVQVLYGFGYIWTFFLVMLFADAVAIVAVMLAGEPVIDVMGGVRYTNRESLVERATLWIQSYGVQTMPIWLAGAIVAFFKIKPTWFDMSPVPTCSSRSLLILSLASVLAFVPLLQIAQPEQVQRREAERLLEQKDFSKALALMSKQDRDDYPPHWDPPMSGWSLDSVREAMEKEWPKQWVAEICLEKIERSLFLELFPYVSDWQRAATLTRRISFELRESQITTARFLLAHPGPMSEPDRQALAEILELGIRP